MTCKGSVAPPQCNASAACTGGCEVSTQADAVCTPPTVAVVAKGTADPSVIAALAVGLPDVFLVAQIEGKNLVEIVAATTGGIKAGVSGSAACASRLMAFVQASAYLNVTLQASASVAGKASAGM